MLAHQTDTIVALATPPGEGGISVIRVSGPAAATICDKAFKGKSALSTAQSHTAHFGRLVEPLGNAIDDVVAVVFKAPTSYTGEDTVELSCHGGILVTKKAIETLIENGARSAEPGEFTKRAFLNGKLDLAQAEAVAELIHARSDRAFRSSIAQLEGRLSEEIQKLRNALIESISLLELELDFVEDGFEFIDKKKAIRQIQDARQMIQNLADSYKSGRIYREGIKVVITGAPNAGKSSLLNALLERNRAIVTHIPGTTRDIIEESISIGGVEFRVVDTAGLRRSKNPVEKEGVKRAGDQAQDCDVLLIVVDATTDVSEQEKKEIVTVREKAPESAKQLVALNKIDLLLHKDGESAKRVEFLAPLQTAKVSAKTGEGIDGLKEVLLKVALEGQKFGSEGRITVTNTRHFEAFKKAAMSLELAEKTLQEGKSGEFATIDLRRALDKLGEITGEVTNDEVLNNIFSKFCIGK